ncbi:MAG: DUF4249 domain-containing protein [Cytophagaceae bacterium]|nr:MAG: DUF4249 domain-containing protein [Cytophagaceae bacterium]
MPKPRNSRGAASLLATLLLLVSGCVDRFQPDVVSTSQRYLVVDGLINLRGVTTVQLARTRSLSTPAPLAEAKATVTIRDEAGTSYPLTEQAPGTYASAALTLDASRRYQLRLRTAAGREYASDLVAGKLTPPIDQLSWALERNGVQLYVDAHDATNNTRYYRWTYQETWQFQTPYYSEFVYANNAVLRRTDNIQTCWRTAGSTDIALGSTIRLSQDVVSKYPLLLRPGNSDRFRIKYSLLVQQYAQSAEEYAYWEKLKKNTESLGTLFDPLPTQLTGNVHGLTDASELVVGYVGASSMSEKRFFIDRSEFPAGTNFLTGYEKQCETPDTVYLPTHYTPVRPFSLAMGFTQEYIPLHESLDSKGVLEGYTRSLGLCADCRLRGTNVKPSFWP